MPFPAIAASAATNPVTTATSHAVSLPSGIAVGELLVVVARAAVPGAIGWPAGWSELFENSDDASDDVTALAYRTADGTESSPITVTHGSGKFCAIAWRISNAEAASVQPPEASIRAIGSSTFPNPEALTPTGGAKDYLWLAIAACQGEPSIGPTWPTNYTLGQIAGTSGSAGAPETNVRLYGAGRQLNAASTDPGPFTISVSNPWTAWTVAVHPATAIIATPSPVVATTSVPSPTVILSAPVIVPGAPGAENIITSEREPIRASARESIATSERETIAASPRETIASTQREKIATS